TAWIPPIPLDLDQVGRSPATSLPKRIPLLPLVSSGSGHTKVLPGEADLGGHLRDPLLHHQRAVACVVAVDLVRYVQLGEPGQIVVDLPDRAARIVLPGEHQHRNLDLLYIRDRRGLSVSLRDLVR